jgi:hypothetical protein
MYMAIRVPGICGKKPLVVFAKKILVQVPSQREACAARKGSSRLDYLTPASLCFFDAAAGIDFLAPDGCSF